MPQKKDFMIQRGDRKERTVVGIERQTYVMPGQRWVETATSPTSAHTVAPLNRLSGRMGGSSAGAAPLHEPSAECDLSAQLGLTAHTSEPTMIIKRFR